MSDNWTKVGVIFTVLGSIVAIKTFVKTEFGDHLIGLAPSVQTQIPSEVEAGPIYNNDDAKDKCNAAATAIGAEWNGEWVTTIWGKQSVCGLKSPERDFG